MFPDIDQSDRTCADAASGAAADSARTAASNAFFIVDLLVWNVCSTGLSAPRQHV
jgi:hypothetical protein